MYLSVLAQRFKPLHRIGIINDASALLLVEQIPMAGILTSEHATTCGVEKFLRHRQPTRDHGDDRIQ